MRVAKPIALALLLSALSATLFAEPEPIKPKIPKRVTKPLPRPVKPTDANTPPTVYNDYLRSLQEFQ
ncbi:MAG: hypothetical protein KC609_16495, partial [Myxococcales bacterium]|nr:hypothetical protein [Myxococcales bacterium]